MLRSEFEENFAQQGAALMIYAGGLFQYSDNAQSNLNSIYVQENNFSGNVAAQVGGAIFVDFNSAADGQDGYPSQICGNAFLNNTAVYGGPAMRILGYLDYQDQAIYLGLLFGQNNTFAGNTAPLLAEYTNSNFNDENLLMRCIYGEQFQVLHFRWICNPVPQNLYIIQRSGQENLQLQCPSGFYCPGGFRDLEIQPGYFQFETQSIANYQNLSSAQCQQNLEEAVDGQLVNVCVGKKACVYLEDATKRQFDRRNNKTSCTLGSYCLTGYTGPLCLACDHAAGYFEDGRNCELCAADWELWTLLAAVLLLLVAWTLANVAATRERMHQGYVFAA